MLQSGSKRSRRRRRKDEEKKKKKIMVLGDTITEKTERIREEDIVA
jgi:hypothetical protein